MPPGGGSHHRQQAPDKGAHGWSLNILYVDTLDAMGIDRSRLRPSGAPFHGVVLGKQAIPLGRIDLPVTFGDPSNFRMETLTFEVVGFRGAYHAILGRPCYAKFMAVSNYNHLKLKMLGPHGVITVGQAFSAHISVMWTVASLSRQS